MKNNIVLCGFMGCGKSTVGRLLAEEIGFTLADSDTCIEQREKMTVSEIFSKHGEGYFREAETAVIKELSEQSGLIIATGGGAVLKSENAAYLRETGLVVFLDVAPETVLKRLEGDTSRPLLMRDDKEAAVNELLSFRRPLYSSASDVTVDANGHVEAVADKILAVYRNELSKS